MMNNGFESDREFREWQAAVAMQYGIQPPVRSEPTETAAKARGAVKRKKSSSPKRRSTDKEAKA
jgi:hypothetical protein